jgi:hypothetical protein
MYIDIPPSQNRNVLNTPLVMLSKMFVTKKTKHAPVNGHNGLINSPKTYTIRDRIINILAYLAISGVLVLPVYIPKQNVTIHAGKFAANHRRM